MQLRVLLLSPRLFTRVCIDCAGSGCAFRDFDWPMPNLLMAGVPGFKKLATGLMKKTFSNKGVASVEERRGLCLEADVNTLPAR